MRDGSLVGSSLKTSVDTNTDGVTLNIGVSLGIPLTDADGVKLKVFEGAVNGFDVGSKLKSV